MEINVLLLSIDLGHMAHRVHYLDSFLARRGVNTKVLDISFRHEPQSTFKFLKNILFFPCIASKSSNRTILFPSLPSIGHNANNSNAFVHFAFSFLEFILVRIISRSVNYNVIVATDPISAFVANAARTSNTFFVYEYLDFYEDLQSGKTRSRFIYLLEKAALKRADLVVSVSKPLEERARQINPNCILVPNGANLGYFTNPHLPREPCIIYAGSIVDWAGLAVPIKGFSILKKKIPSITMKIVGDGKEKHELEILVQNLSLEDSVFFTGKLPYGEMADLLCKSSLGLAMFKPSKAAAFASPLKLFDYMAAGLPIIATDIGDIGRILRESYSGFAIKWDVEEFVKAAETLLTKQNIWLSFHEKGLCYVKKYSWDKLFDYWLMEIKNRLKQRSKA